MYASESALNLQSQHVLKKMDCRAMAQPAAQNTVHAAAVARLEGLFQAALRGIAAETRLPKLLPPRGHAGRTCLIAVGKAAAEMAAVASQHFGPTLSGLVVTRAGHGVAAGRIAKGIEIVEAGHPVPDTQSQDAARKALALAKSLRAQDRLIALISGGGSALLSLPAPGVSLSDKQLTTRALLHSGATIAEINCVRKHVSRIKGGRLAVAAAPAHVFTLVVSDIPGDDPSLVASGPTLPDCTTLAEARQIVERYPLQLPSAVAAALAAAETETPPADAPGLAGGKVEIVACARDALRAAADEARLQNYAVTDLGDDLQAEARDLGAAHGALARRLAQEDVPRVILSGGETTVTVKHSQGRGGRNLEYLLALAIELNGAAGISAIACDTDGIDGTESNAGAIITPDTLLRAKALGLDARAALDANDSYSYFAALGDLVITGPTRTNVNDFRAITIANDI
jgi:hydroxypyruvate reductase